MLGWLQWIRLIQQGSDSQLTVEYMYWSVEHCAINLHSLLYLPQVIDCLAMYATF